MVLTYQSKLNWSVAIAGMIIQENLLPAYAISGTVIELRKKKKKKKKKEEENKRIFSNWRKPRDKWNCVHLSQVLSSCVAEPNMMKAWWRNLLSWEEISPVLPEVLLWLLLDWCRWKALENVHFRVHDEWCSELLPASWTDLLALDNVTRMGRSWAFADCSHAWIISFSLKHA